MPQQRWIAFSGAVILAMRLVALGAVPTQQQPPDFTVNPIPQARQMAAPPAAQPGQLSPRAKDLADWLRAATQELRAAGKANIAANAKEREEAETAAKVLRARVGPSLTLRFRDREGTPSLISGKALQPAVKGTAQALDRDVATAREFLRTNRELFGIEDPDRELAVTRKQRDHLSFGQVRLEQSYQGIAVWPSELIVHLDSDGSVYRANGSLIRTPKRLPTNPTVVKDAAAQLARKAVEAPVNMNTSDPQLIIYSSEEQAPRLGWKMEIEVGLAAHWLVVVDAHTGGILTKFNQVTDASVPASGVDLFGVTRQISAWEENGVYYLIDTSKPMFDGSQNPVETFGAPGVIYILDAGSLPPDPSEQNVEPLYWVQSSGPMFSFDAAVSAAHSLSQTYDYYLESHGRNSLDGSGAAIIAVVRVGDGFPNAFVRDQIIYFGDAQPYAGALDVVAHELTHAVIRTSADLVYQGESGALNEAFADILGEMVEARTDGAPDWSVGSRLSSPMRDMRTPSLFDQPERMGEFITADDAYLDNFVNRDNGGVHINSGIINRAYYLLAEGLPNAIGIADAEQIFYRALTVHLFKNAQFIDARHACIAAAEELFGSPSSQAARVAEAFEAVEIFDDAPTAPPSSFDAINAPDSTLFVFFDSEVGYYRLGRRETELGDGALGAKLSQFDAGLTRPAVSGDGTWAVFVDSFNDVCFIPTDGSLTEDCLGFQDTFYSIAMSPQGNQVAAVFLNESGEPENMISIIDVDEEQNSRDILLRAPLIDGGGAVQVDSADAMAFSSSGNLLFYDAFNEVSIGDGSTYETWSIYAIDLTTDLILPVVPPLPGIDFAYPALSKTSDRFIVFDALDSATGVSFLFTMNLFTGALTTVGLVNGDYGVPSFTGDDSAIVYSYPDVSSTGLSLVRQEVDPETMEPISEPTVWLKDADFGVIYRRGAFLAPGEGDNCPDDSNKTEPGICGCGVPDTDGDGDGVDDCIDDCPNDSNKTEAGQCGCGVPEGMCAPAGPGSCGAGVSMITFVLPVLAMLRFLPTQRRASPTRRRSC